MSGRLQGKTAFVTAGAQGIGRATARAFAREGATVTVDGQAQEGATPLELTLAPGMHKIAVAAEVARLVPFHFSLLKIKFP